MGNERPVAKRLCREELVHVLLVLGEENDGLPVCDEVTHIFRLGGHVYAVEDRTEALRSEVKVEPLGSALPHHHHARPCLDAELFKAEGGLLHDVAELSPCDFVPDPEVFVAEGHSSRPAVRASDEPLNQRHVRRLFGRSREVVFCHPCLLGRALTVSSQGHLPSKRMFAALTPAGHGVGAALVTVTA